MSINNMETKYIIITVVIHELDGKPQYESFEGEITGSNTLHRYVLARARVDNTFAKNVIFYKEF